MTITIPLKGGSLSKTYRLPQYNIVRKEVSRTENREDRKSTRLNSSH